MDIENLTITDQIKDEYIQWLKDTKRSKYEMTDVFINDNGNVKIEKRMSWVAKTSPEDWREFCKATDREYIGEMKLLAIY